MTTQVLLFLNGSFSFSTIIRKTIKAGMSLNFGPTPSPTTELAALRPPSRTFKTFGSLQVATFNLAENPSITFSLINKPLILQDQFEHKK